VTIESKVAARLNVLGSIVSHVMHYRIPGHNQLEHDEGLSLDAYVENGKLIDFDDYVTTLPQTMLTLEAQRSSKWRDLVMVLSTEEMAAIWHLPDVDFSAERILWSGGALPADVTQEMGNTQAIQLGISDRPGKQPPVFLRNQDRAYHHYILGKSGMGKSTLQLNMIVQDINAGRGVAVIDPHGKLIEDVIASVDEPETLLVLNCADKHYPVPLNPFRIPQGVSYEAVLSNNLWAIQKLYESPHYQGRMGNTLRFMLEALLCDPEATPLDVQRLFTDDGYRNQVIEQLEDSEHATRQSLAFWERYDTLSRSEKRELEAPITTRTGAFLANQTLEYMTCHPNTLNFLQLVREQTPVLINLAGEAIGNEAGNLAALFIAGFFSASQTLGDIGNSAPPRYYLYIDELERVVTSPLQEILAQVRKFGLSLVMAHQYIDQMPTETVKGILGNVGTTSIFEVGINDAKTLSPYFEPEVERTTLMNLGKGHMAIKTRAQGKTLPAFTVSTLPPPPQNEVELILLEEKQAEYDFLPQQEVKTWLNNRYGRRKKAASGDRNPSETPYQPGQLKKYDDQ
jgi:hypothetical protein